MNTHDKIELPPNPITPLMAALIDKASGAGTADTIWQLVQEFAYQSIEAYRIKREDYINDDRDMLRAEIVALKGTIADLESQLEAIGAGGVTQGQRLTGDRRGGPVVMREICPECGHQFECFHNGYINELRAAHDVPQPAEPAKERFDEWLENPYAKVLEQSIKEDHAPKCAEPAKVPSDDDLFAIHDEYFPTMVLGHENYLSFARAVLARYGSKS